MKEQNVISLLELPITINEKDTHRNAIIKDMDSLLRKIDPRVSWTDYIPGKYLSTGWDLVAIGVGNTAKYVNVSDKSPFKLVNEVLNAMDDYRLDTQFLNNRQFAMIESDIMKLTKTRILLISNAKKLLNDLSNEDCLNILYQAQEKGYLPRLYLEDIENYNGSEAKNLLMKDLETNKATLLDTMAISELIETFYLKEMESELEI